METNIILKKIEEMKSENNRLWGKLDVDYAHKTEFFGDEHEHNFFNNYDGESVSHILDILDEQNWILQRLESFIKKENPFDKEETVYDVVAMKPKWSSLNQAESVTTRYYNEAIEFAKKYEDEGYCQVYIRKVTEMVYTEE